MPCVISNQTDESTGPRTIFGDTSGHPFFIVGSWAKVNNIDSQDRALVISVAHGLQLVGLTTAPAGTPTSDLCVDANGNVYRQS